MADGYLIPGEVRTGNCYRVFMDGRCVAIVRTEAVATVLIEAISKPSPGLFKFTYQLAYIEGAF